MKKLLTIIFLVLISFTVLRFGLNFGDSEPLNFSDLLYCFTYFKFDLNNTILVLRNFGSIISSWSSFEPADFLLLIPKILDLVIIQPTGLLIYFVSDILNLAISIFNVILILLTGNTSAFIPYITLPSWIILPYGA